MKINIKITFLNGETGIYEGSVQHMWCHLKGDKHNFSGYWPDEERELLNKHSQSDFFRGADFVKMYLTRFAEQYGASIEIKEEGEAIDYPYEDGVKY